MTLGEWIKNYRDKHSLSMQEMADMCGFSKAYIGQLEKGINPSTGKPISPTIQAFDKIAQAVGLDLDVFLKELDGNQLVTLLPDKTGKPSSPTKGIRIPVLGRVAAGIPIEAITDIEGWEELPTKMTAGGEYFALRIKGSSMEPKLLEGDIVIVRKQNDVDNGDTAIVLVNGDEATVKQIKKTDTGIMLVGLNVEVYQPHFYTNKEIEQLPIQIIGKVIESRHTW